MADPTDVVPHRCENPKPHDPPRGCVTFAADGSWVPDRHKEVGDE